MKFHTNYRIGVFAEKQSTTGLTHFIRHSLPTDMDEEKPSYVCCETGTDVWEVYLHNFSHIELDNQQTDTYADEYINN
jgi:hypothetical protein